MKNGMITIVANKYVQEHDLDDKHDLGLKLENLLEKLSKGAFGNSVEVEGVRFSICYVKIESGTVWKKESEV
jgi:hypothetical protein